MATDYQSESALGDPPTDHARAQQIIAMAARLAMRAEDFDTVGERVLQQLVTTVTGTTAGAIWLLSEQSRLKLTVSHGFEQQPVFNQPNQTTVHNRLLKRYLGDTRPSAYPAGTEVDGVALSQHLLLAPIIVGEAPLGIVELTLKADQPIADYSAAAHLLSVIACVLGDWLARDLRQHTSEQAKQMAAAGEFAKLVHASRDLRTVCGVVANEARRLVQCDRVSVATGRRSLHLRAVSGQVSIDHRANQVVALNHLLRLAAPLGEPLCYDGDASHLPPQVEQTLDRYVDESYVKQLLILPLHEQTPPSSSSHDEPPSNRNRTTLPPNEQRLTGALVFECFEADQPLEQISHRATNLLEHSQSSISHAVAIQRVPLMPLWQALGSIGGWRGAKVAQVIAVLVTLVALLTLWPARFTIRTTGTLQPQQQRHLYAGIDGVVEKVHVRHGEKVEPGQVLLEISNSSIDEAFHQLEHHRLHERLLLRSQVAGEVVTWNARQRLLQRPVEQGDTLLTVADPEGAWELELFVPDHRLGHVLRASQESSDPLPVEFIVATDPTKKFIGRLREVEKLSQNYPDLGWGAMAKVDVDPQPMGALKSPARASAKIVCGQRSLGFTWFGELFEWFSSHVFF